MSLLHEQAHEWEDQPTFLKHTPPIKICKHCGMNEFQARFYSTTYCPAWCRGWRRLV